MLEPIVNRLKKRLEKQDLADIRQALIKYVIDFKLVESEIVVDADLVEKLLPYLVKESSNWSDLEGDI